MDVDSAAIGAWVGQFVWPFLRLSAFLLAAPLFGARSVPVRVRITIAVALAALLVPTLPPMPAVDFLSPLGLMTALQQVGIGVLGGFLLQLFLAALTFAGEMVSLGMMMLSPMIISLPFKIMLFVLVDGWSLVLGTLAGSFYR